MSDVIFVHPSQSRKFCSRLFVMLRDLDGPSGLTSKPRLLATRDSVPQGLGSIAVSLICPMSRGTERNETEWNPFSAASRYVSLSLSLSVGEEQRRGGASAKRSPSRGEGREEAAGGGEGRWADERRERSQFSNGPEKVAAIHLLTYITLVSCLPPLSPIPLPLSTGLTPTRAHRQPTNCPVTHEPVVHVIAVTHKVTPGGIPSSFYSSSFSSSSSPSLCAAPLPPLTFPSCFMLHDYLLFQNYVTSCRRDHERDFRGLGGRKQRRIR